MSVHSVEHQFNQLYAQDKITRRLAFSILADAPAVMWMRQMISKHSTLSGISQRQQHFSYVAGAIVVGSTHRQIQL